MSRYDDVGGGGRPSHRCLFGSLLKSVLFSRCWGFSAFMAFAAGGIYYIGICSAFVGQLRGGFVDEATLAAVTICQQQHPKTRRPVMGATAPVFLGH